MRRTAALIAAIAVAMAVTVPPAAAVTPRASLTDIENDVMCVVCNTPLAVSQSPEANRERAFISGLIAKGETKSQIEQALVTQYGPSVLALPPAHGFNLTVYVLPPAIVVLGAIGLLYALPKWKRRSRAQAAGNAQAAAPPLDPLEAERLEQDLAHHDV